MAELHELHRLHKLQWCNVGYLRWSGYMTGGIGTGLGSLTSGNLLAIDIISSTVALAFAVDDNVARSTPAKQEWLITLP